MIELKRSKDKLQAKITDSVTLHVQNIDLSSFLILGKDAFNLLSPIVNHLNTLRTTSQYTQFHNFASQVGPAFVKWNMKKLPTRESAWQDLIIHIYEFVLSRSDSRMCLSSRVKNWNCTISTLLTMLRDQYDLIPIGVEIPRIKRKSDADFYEGYRHKLIGEVKPSIVKGEVNKLLVSVSLSRTDAEYLDEIRERLANRRRVIDECLLAWWSQIKSHYEYGQRLLQTVDWSGLQARLVNGEINAEGSEYCRTTAHIANSWTEQGLANLLAIIRHNHHGCYGMDVLRESPYLPSIAYRLSDSTPNTISKDILARERINWMLGNMTAMDIAVCAGILIMHNPTFTAHSLLMARVQTKKGKKYLEIGDKSATFRIEKHRAKAMKMSTLDEISLEIIQTVIEMTSSARSYLRSKNKKISNFLFIQHDGGRYGVTDSARVVGKISGNHNSLTIFDFFPALLKAGLKPGDITFKKIRATEGVLEWFKTGSVKAMSKKIGNSRQVALTYYLPQPLLNAYNARLIRRFQNLWLATAAAHEAFQLEATDFSTLGELHAFLNQMLEIHSRNSSPLAAALHERFRSRDNDLEAAKQVENARLNIPVNKNTVAAVYLYKRAVIKSGVTEDVLQTADAVVGLTPRAVVHLADILQHQLPLHRDPEMRKSHAEALKLVEGLEDRLNWCDLLIMRGTR